MTFWKIGFPLQYLSWTLNLSVILLVSYSKNFQSDSIKFSVWNLLLPLKRFILHFSCVFFRIVALRMAEAHAAVAFSFTVSSEGISVDINRQAAGVLRKSGTRALKKRIARFKVGLIGCPVILRNSICFLSRFLSLSLFAPQNSLYNQVYPFHPSSWFYFAFGVFGATYLGYDYKKSPLPYIEEFLIRWVKMVFCGELGPSCPWEKRPAIKP